MAISNKKERVYFDLTIIFSVILFCTGFTLYIIYFEKDLVRLIAGCLIQIGLSLVIIDILISKLGQAIFRQKIREDLREEIIALVKKYPYKVSNVVCKRFMKYSRNICEDYNLDMLEKTKLNIMAMEDNVHYRFRRLSTNIDGKLNFKVLFDGILLNNEKDLHYSGNGVYQIIHKLKKG